MSDETSPGPDDPSAALADAASHVQDAVLALVAAGRAALDVVERLARDPGPLLDAAARAAEAGRDAASTWVAPGAGPPSYVRPDPGPPDASDEGSTAPTGSGTDRPGPSRRPRVEHIRVEADDG